MKCPKCNNIETRVVDSRVVEDGKAIKRRRECEYCSYRYTTFERVSITDLTVLKKDGSKELYDRGKIKRSMMLALTNRNVDVETIDDSISSMESKWIGMGKEISFKEIGDEIMVSLKSIDIVGYIRFASVYKNFESMEDFQEIIKGG